MVKAMLIKPLDGQPEGTERELSQADFNRLKAQGAVRAADDKKAAQATLNKKAPEVANKSAKSAAQIKSAD